MCAEQVDLLINNAGIGLHGEFASLPLDRQLAVLNLNVMALTKLTHLFLEKTMQQREPRGKILNVASIAGYAPGLYESNHKSRFEHHHHLNLYSLLFFFLFLSLTHTHTAPTHKALTSMYLSLLSFTHHTQIEQTDNSDYSPLLAGPEMSVYFASKAFVISFTESLNFELRNTKVSASVVCPGPADTKSAPVNHAKLLFDDKP